MGQKGISLIHTAMQDTILMNWSSSKKDYEKTMELFDMFSPDKEWSEIPESYKKRSLDQLLDDAMVH